MNILDYIDVNIIYLGIGIIALMMANIALGAGISMVDNNQTFDLQKLIKGILKAFLVTISFILIYISGILNADIITIDISGQTVTLIDGINIILTFSAGIYAKNVFEKLTKIIALKTESK